MNFSPQSAISHMVTSNHYLVIALSNNVIKRIDVEHSDKNDGIYHYISQVRLLLNVFRWLKTGILYSTDVLLLPFLWWFQRLSCQSLRTAFSIYFWIPQLNIWSFAWKQLRAIIYLEIARRSNHSRNWRYGIIRNTYEHEHTTIGCHSELAVVEICLFVG